MMETRTVWKDIYSVFKCYKSPVTLDELISELPWIDTLDDYVDNFVRSGLLNKASFCVEDSRITLYWPTTRALMNRKLEDDSEISLEVKNLELVKKLIESNELPPYDLYSEGSEEKLKNEYLLARRKKSLLVARLWKLNDSPLKATSVLNVDVGDCPKTAEAHIQGLSQTRRAKIKDYNDMKELVRLLAGLISERRQRSMDDVIQEYIEE